MQELPGFLGEIITGVVVALTTWFFSRRQNEATAEALELDLVDRAIKIWREQSEVLYGVVASLRADMNELSRENESLRKEVDKQRKEVEKLRKDNEHLKRKLSKYDKTYADEHEQGH